METYEKLLLMAGGGEAVVFKLQLRFEGEEEGEGETIELEGTTLGVVLDGPMALVDGMAGVFDPFIQSVAEVILLLGTSLLTNCKFEG